MALVSGIGLCIAKEVLALGANVLVVSRNEEGVNSAAGKTPAAPMPSEIRAKVGKKFKEEETKPEGLCLAEVSIPDATPA